MSSEQARGQEVDRRTDIWAFGCVLFEMLSGRRAFDGDTISDTFVRVLEREPDWDALPRDTPSAVRTLLGRCLRKDPQKRLHDIADAILDIDDASANPQDAAVIEPASNRFHWPGAALPWLVAGALAVALLWAGWLSFRPSTPVPAEAVQLTIHSPEGGGNSYFALSPDGRYLAFTPVLTGRPMLWVHSVVTNETKALPGTEGARWPFWKPDSQEIAFLAGDQLKTVALRGGSPVVIATASSSTGRGAWAPGNVIVVPKPGEGLQKITAGGRTEALTALRTGELGHGAPVFLPDGIHFLFVVRTAGNQSLELRIGSIESKEMAESLGPVESSAGYADGHLFFVRSGHIGGGSLTVQAFDPVRRRRTGDAIALGLPAATYQPTSYAAFSVSAEANRLVYLPRTGALYDLTWYNRSGEKVGTVGDPGVYFHLDLSPDDRRVAVSRQTQEPGKPVQLDIWAIDLKPGAGASRVTGHPAYEAESRMVWRRSPTGVQLEPAGPP